MEAYASVLLIAIPFIFSLVILEFLYSLYKGTKTFRSMDTISSLSSGVSNTLKSILGLTIVIVGYETMAEKLAVIHIETTWLAYVIAFVVLDFATYCSHWLMHNVNIFWNKHLVHHSSEEFNLAVALRQPVSELFSIGILFLLPAALLGVSPEIIAILTPIHFFLQIWIHTPHIPKLGFIEYILVTPSQHRVHHAINDIYLDKNLSPVFCIWDRMFGTFQEELEDVPPVYGAKHQIRTWNPIKQNFIHVISLIKDAWRTKNEWDKFRIWFMPTGWRPKDVAVQYPIEVSHDVYAIKKFETKASIWLHLWSWAQYGFTNLFLLHMMIQFADIGFPNLLIYGGFLFASIYSYTSLMDRDRNTIWMEAIRCLFGLGIISWTRDWFSLNEIIPGGSVIVAAYLLCSMVIVAWFVWGEFSERVEAPIEQHNFF